MALSQGSTDVWERVRASAVARPREVDTWSPLESDVGIIEELVDAPPRTMHLPAIVRSSPGSPVLRSWIERREFGRPYDSLSVDLAQAAVELPGLELPEGNARFLADESSYERFELSVECLLQHRKQLVAATVNPDHPRRRAFVLGAGPGGLCAAVQLALRDHDVVVCEMRESYARNRFIGVYKYVAHLLASLGMPASMTYDFSLYRGKAGSTLADIQTFLHAIALKLGVVIYTGAVVRRMELDALQRGEVELDGAHHGGSMRRSIGVTRWQHDAVSIVRSGVRIRFDTVVEATGGRSGLRELLVGEDKVASLREIAQTASARDRSLETFFADPDDHCTDFVESDYGAPPDQRAEFAAALAERPEEIPDEMPSFVSNIDASVITQPIQQLSEAAGIAVQVGDRRIDVPPDWVLVETPLTDGRLTRYQVEGPLPATFEFGGQRLRTRDHIATIDPMSFLVRVLYAAGVPFEAVDRQRLVDFYNVENASADASDIVALWIARFSGLLIGGDDPIWMGTVPGTTDIQYGIVGEALQNAWYRFGVGVDDTFVSATRFVESLELPAEQRRELARLHEKVMLARSIHITFHHYWVSRHRDQGVVGGVLTENHMANRHEVDIAMSALRETARHAAEIIRTADEVCGADRILDAALDQQLRSAGRRILDVLGDLGHDAGLLRRTRQAIGAATPEPDIADALEQALTSEDADELRPFLDWLAGRQDAPSSADAKGREERIIELSLGRHAWVRPWLRAVATGLLDPTSSAARPTLQHLVEDDDALVAEIAAAVLDPDSGAMTTLDKVELLERVSLFSTIPHEILAEVAPLLTERRAIAEERIVSKGEVGDCLYLIASGRVRVHDGGRVLRELGALEHFGELSLIDAEPRSADVTGVEPTHLLRLDQAAFTSLVAARPEILHAVSRVLCGQLRTLTASS